MSNILGMIGQFIATIVSCVGDWLGLITREANEGANAPNVVLGIFCIALPLCGLGIGLLRRLIKTRG